MFKYTNNAVDLLDKFILNIYITIMYPFRLFFNYINLKYKNKKEPHFDSFQTYIRFELSHPNKNLPEVEYIRVVFLTYLFYFTYEFIFEFLFFICYDLFNFFLFLGELVQNLINFKKYIIYTISQAYNYYLLNSYAFIFFIFFFYIFTTVCLTVFSFFFGVRGVFFISLFSIFSFWLIQFAFINDFFFDSITIYTYYKFLNYTAGTLVFSFNLKIEFVSYSFLFLTSTIGVCAVVYSLSYFKNEPETDKFIILINWFILSMCLLVLADNALLLFLGWELIGLTSFLLINFWTLRRNTLKSAFKAFAFNKISDVFLLFFIVLMTHQTGTLNVTNWYTYYLLNNNYNFVSFYPISIFLVLASSIKSAQILGHFWLPDSMEAPIPASALIHSATLVSSGVYLLLKFNWILQVTNFNIILIILGSLTACYGGVVSAAQTDCKKLLAYSTISHCGFLFVTVGLNNIYLTITYLYLHGFFKALTFFCVGNLVKVSKGYQDSRKMGQLFSILPIESVLLVMCASNLGALPFTVGYFYKMFFQTIIINNNLLLFVLPFILIGMLSSVIYVFRLIFYTLFDIQKNNNTNFDYYFNVKFNSKYHSNTTELGIIFIFLLFCVSLYIYFFYILFFKNFSFFNIVGNVQYFEIIEIYQKNTIEYFHFFYIFFSVTIFLIMRVTCREEFSFLKKNYMCYYFFLFFLFLQFISYFLMLFY